MSPKQHTQLDNIYAELEEQLDSQTPEIIWEAVAIQILTAREARARIENEGSVVRDPKGSVIPHPALKIEADAIKIYTSLVKTHASRE